MALQHPNMTVAHRQLTAKERQILEKQVLVHVDRFARRHTSRIGDVGGSGR
jgi:hypothetical protein